MPTKETTAQLIVNVRAYLRSRWPVPTAWVQELLAEYDKLKVVADTADAWRRAYNNRVASATGLVDGQGAAYWARHCMLSEDTLQEYINKYAALSTRHEALSAEYLALRKQSWENEYKDMYASYAALNREYSDLRVKYDRLQHVATECEDELREIRQINS